VAAESTERTIYVITSWQKLLKTGQTGAGFGQWVSAHVKQSTKHARTSWYPCTVNVERTMQFILESQARAEIRMEKWEIRVEKVEARMAKTESHIDAMEKRFDKRMDAITRILQQGMRMLVKIETRVEELAEAQKNTDRSLKELVEKQKELAEAQKHTDRSLKALIKSLRNGRNGRF
jgi:predicted  nucleic acid-binding Zn-ribbon protein